MAVFISEYFQYNFEKVGVFDAVMDADSHYFINITRIKDSNTPEFTNSYKKVNSYFQDIILLLDTATSNSKSDRSYREAIKRFNFPEVNGINLGFSTTLYGSAFGESLKNQVIEDAYYIVKSGTKEPEIFHLIGLFENGIGPDRLSDMFATIIKDDIYNYTRRINIEAGITPEKYPNEKFNHGVVYNPFKKCDLLLLPKEILNELPIAKSWDDVDRVIFENDAIRAEVNQIIGENWYNYTLSDKKDFLKQNIFKDPEKIHNILESYQSSHAEECDWCSDLEYISEKIFKEIKKVGSGFLQHSESPIAITSQDAMLHVCEIFKEWVEENKGWSVILSVSDKAREKIVQRLIHLSAKEFINANNLDLNFESDLGRGPEDFKISRGADKSICEVKLSSNNQYLHGYDKQIEEYGKAEATEKLFFMFVDVGNPGRKAKIVSTHQQNLQTGILCPELIIIDSTEKEPASIY